MTTRAMAILAVVGVTAVTVATAAAFLGHATRQAAPSRAAVGAAQPSRTTPALPAHAAAVVRVIPVGRPYVDVPILEYHYVRTVSDPLYDPLGFRLSVTPANFAAQMSWLAAHGYHPITFADLRTYFAGRKPLPSKPVILTFDDGYRDFLTNAEPILRAHDFEAVTYVVPGFWGWKSAYMTPPDLIALDRSGLVEIGSHTVNHVNLTTESTRGLAYQLDASRAILQSLLGHSVVDFCYPSGRYNARVIAAVARAGYESATTEVPGIALAWSDRFEWPRVRVSGGESLESFAAGLGSPDATVAIVSRPAGPPRVLPGLI